MKKTMGILCALAVGALLCMGAIAASAEEIILVAEASTAPQPIGAALEVVEATESQVTGEVSAPVLVAPPAPAQGTVEAVPVPQTVAVLPETAVVETGEALSDGNWVMFYDWYGEVFFQEFVSTGMHAVEPPEAPEVEDYVFQFWFDTAQEIVAPFNFETTIRGELMLFPYYLTEAQSKDAAVTQASTVPEIIEQQANDIMKEIMGDVLPENQDQPQGVTAAELLEKAEAAERAMSAEQEWELLVGILGYGEEDLPEELEGIVYAGVIDKSQEESVGVLSAQEGNELIASILSGLPAASGEETDLAETAEASGAEATGQVHPFIQELTGGAEENATSAGQEGAEQDEAYHLTVEDIEPRVSVTYEYQGELTMDTQVTVVAHVDNVPEGEGFTITYQWQNDASGVFADVPGATGPTHTYTVREYGESGCRWRAEVKIIDAEGPAGE